MFLTEDEVLKGVKDTDQKYQCEIFNFVDLCGGVGHCVVDNNPNTSQ